MSTPTRFFFPSPFFNMTCTFPSYSWWLMWRPGGGYGASGEPWWLISRAMRYIIRVGQLAVLRLSVTSSRLLTINSDKFALLEFLLVRKVGKADARRLQQ